MLNRRVEVVLGWIEIRINSVDERVQIDGASGWNFLCLG